MRIASFEIIPVALPFLEPYITATGTLERREMVLLRLEDESGNAGWGDGVPLSLRGGASLSHLIEELDNGVRAELDAAAFDPEADAEPALDPILDRCRARGIEPPALAALNAALLDLLGEARGEPAWRLLGARRPAAVDCNGTLGAGEPDAVAAKARALTDSGFRSLKVKVGAAADQERLNAVRAAVGPDIRLRVDANGAWEVAQARHELNAMHADVGLELAEQPCRTLADLAAVRGSLDLPIVADESVADLEGAKRAVELGACDAATIKLAKVGGVREALRVADRIPAYLSSALDSPLGIAAALHTAQVLPRDAFAGKLAHGLATTSLFADNVADVTNFLGPTLEVSSAPGLGVEIDEAAVERLRIP